MSDYQDYTFNVKISINALSPEEGGEIIHRALMERIDGWTLDAQRQAHVGSVSLAECASLAYLEAAGAELAEEYVPVYEAIVAAKHQS
jgi:hypothetical protein